MDIKLFNALIKEANYIKEYDKNQIIIEEGEQCNELALIIKGSVIIASYTFYGNEIVFNELNANQFFGQSLIFSSSPIYKGKIISKSKTKIAFINKQKLKSLLKNAELLESYLNALSDEVLLSKEKGRILAFSETQDRLLYYLSIHPQIQIKSISNLAKTLCVTRESLSRTLYRLKNQNKINFNGKVISLIY